MKKSKIISFDLDFTLVNAKENVREDDAKEIKKIEENGDYGLINTGRHYIRGIKAAEQAGIRYILSFNGTTLWDNKEKKELFNSHLNVNAVEKVIEYCIEHKHLIGFWLKDEVALLDFSDDGSQHVDYYKDVERWKPLVPTKHKHHNEDIDIKKWISDNGSNVYKIQLLFKKEVWEQTRFEVEKDLNDIVNGSATVFMGSLPDIEVCTLGTSKLNGINKMVETLNIKDYELYSFGDGYNDLEVLKGSDYAYVMDSATSDEVYATATEVLEYDSGSIGRKINDIYNK